MKDTGKRHLLIGLTLVFAFAVFTWLLQNIDVKPLGVNGTSIGFASWNCGFHQFWGVHMALYHITDWAGLVPIFAAFAFGVMGLCQLISRRSIRKVDTDILILGGYYTIVITLYVVFEMIPINFRPILINGLPEPSYPSSTTLLVLAVMPTVSEQVFRRCKKTSVQKTANILTISFSAFMVVCRLLSGVHWFTDIFGAVLLSIGLFFCYTGFVRLFCREI